MVDPSCPHTHKIGVSRILCTSRINLTALDDGVLPHRDSLLVERLDERGGAALLPHLVGDLAHAVAAGGHVRRLDDLVQERARGIVGVVVRRLLEVGHDGALAGTHGAGDADDLHGAGEVEGSAHAREARKG